MLDHHTRFKQKFYLLLLVILIVPPLGLLYYEYRAEMADQNTVTIPKFQDHTETNAKLSLKHIFRLRGNVKQIELSKDGKTAYVCADSRGVYIVDLQKPLKPKIISQFKYFKNSYDKARNIALSKDQSLLFVRDAQAGIYSVDISNPTEPILLTTYASESPMSGFVLSADAQRLYISHTDGLTIADIRSHDQIIPIASLKQKKGYLGLVETADDLLYLLNNYGVDIVDISSIQEPRLVGKFDSLGRPEKIMLSNRKTRAYLSCGNAGVEIIDLNNPMSPKPAGSFTTAGFANSTSVSKNGDTIYVSNSNNDIEIVDVTDPDNPKLRHRIHEDKTQPRQVLSSTLSIDEKILYIAHGTLGMAIVELP